jgi:hypothetical protein
MTSKPLTRFVGRIKSIKAKQTNAKRSLARRGEFNILWAIVAVVGIALGLFLIFYVFHGAMPSLGASNTLTVTAEELGGVLVINIKAMGVSATTVTGIQLLATSPTSNTASTSSATSNSASSSGPSASDCTAYLNGNSNGVSINSLPATDLSITLHPGDTLSITCTSITGSPTEIEVFTTGSTYVAPIS